MNKKAGKLFVLVFLFFSESTLYAQSMTALFNLSGTKSMRPFFAGAEYTNASSLGMFYEKHWFPYVTLFLPYKYLVLQGGLLQTSFEDGLLLSNGGYRSYYSAPPYLNPLGFSLGFKHPRIDRIQGGLFHYALLPDFHTREKDASGISLGCLQTNLKGKIVSFYGSISKYFLHKESPSSDYSFYGDLGIRWLSEEINLSVSYSSEIGRRVSVYGSLYHIQAGYSDFSKWGDNPFSSEMYKNSFQEFFVKTSFMHWKGGFRDRIFFSQTRYEQDNGGIWTSYLDRSVQWLGVFIYPGKTDIRPALHYYKDPGRPEFMVSIGVKRKKEAAFSFLFLNTFRRHAYPLDPVFFPGVLYEDNLSEDRKNYFAGRLRGFEFYYIFGNIHLAGFALLPEFSYRRNLFYYDFRFKFLKEW